MQGLESLVFIHDKITCLFWQRTECFTRPGTDKFSQIKKKQKASKYPFTDRLNAQQVVFFFPPVCLRCLCSSELTPRSLWSPDQHVCESVCPYSWVWVCLLRPHLILRSVAPSPCAPASDVAPSSCETQACLCC